MEVDRGMFAHYWGPPWEATVWPARCDTNITLTSSSTDVRITVTGQPLGPPTNLRGRAVALGWGDRDAKSRLHVPSTKMWSYDYIRSGPSRGYSRWDFMGIDPPRLYQAGGLVPGLNNVRATQNPTLPQHRDHIHYAWKPGGLIPTPVPTTGGNAVPENLPQAAMSARGRGSADLVPGRLRGYREWRLAPADDLLPARLVSITAGTVWPWTPINQAHCHRTQIGRRFHRFSRVVNHDPDDVPNAECTCGIYAKHKPDIYPANKHLGGAIEAWGPTQLGDTAFRARYARLVALCASRSWATPDLEQAELAAAQYKVPLFPTVQDMVDAYPPVDVTDLLAPDPEPEPGPEALTFPPMACCSSLMFKAGAVFFAGQHMATEWACVACGTKKLTVP